MHAKLLQSCPTLYDQPGSSVHGILQARILEWIAMPYSRGSSQLRDWTLVSCGSCTAGRFFTTEPPEKSPFSPLHPNCCCSVTQQCPTLCDIMDCSMPGFPVFHCLPEFAQICVNWVSDAILSTCGVFLMLDILTAVQWYLFVFLICIFLMTSDFEHLSMCLLASYIFFGRKCLFRCFADFSIELFGFLIPSYMKSLYILDPLSDITLWKAIWRFLKKLKIELPYNPAIALLSICTKKMKTLIWKYVYTPMFISIVHPLSHIWLFWPHGLQHTRLPCPSPTPRDIETYVHQVSDAIQPPHPLSSPSSPTFNFS